MWLKRGYYEQQKIILSLLSKKGQSFSSSVPDMGVGAHIYTYFFIISQ